MDESWRLPLGWLVPAQIPPEESPTDACRSLRVNDFLDVFGGPPPALLRRHLSFGGGDLTPSNSPLSFYTEVFKPPPPLTLSFNAGRRLPSFTIPSPPAKVAAVVDDGDDGFSSFMTKLRPITVRRERMEGEDYTAASLQSFTRRRTAGCAAAARIIESCIRLFRHDHSSPEVAADWRHRLPEEETSCGSNSPFSEISSIYDDVPMAMIRSPRPEEAAAVAALARVAAEAEASIVAAARGEVAKEEWSTALDDAVAWAREKSRL